MAGSQENLGAKKEAAILALLSSRSVEDAARASDVPVRTLYRWLKEPDFCGAYREAKRTSFAGGRAATSDVECRCFHVGQADGRSSDAPVGKDPCGGQYSEPYRSGNRDRGHRSAAFGS